MSLYCLAKNEWSWASLKVKYPILIGRLVDWRYWFRHALTATLNLQFTTQKYHQICHTCPFSVGRIGRPSPIFQNHPGFAHNALARPADILKTKIIIRMDQNGTLINRAKIGHFLDLKPIIYGDWSFWPMSIVHQSWLDTHLSWNFISRFDGLIMFN